MDKVKDGQVSNTKTLSLDSKRNLLYSFSNKLIATVGVSDLIVIETPDALLLCHKDRADDVKDLVQKLEKNEPEEEIKKC